MKLSKLGYYIYIYIMSDVSTMSKIGRDKEILSYLKLV